MLNRSNDCIGDFQPRGAGNFMAAAELFRRSLPLLPEHRSSATAQPHHHPHNKQVMHR
jgi:hypothetical protein